MRFSVLARRRPAPPSKPVERWWENVRRGRAQRTRAAATAFSALPLGLEIYFEHFRGSFGGKWMWTRSGSPRRSPQQVWRACAQGARLERER